MTATRRSAAMMVLLSASFAGVATAQAPSLSARIRAGDVGALEVAAASGNRAWIEDIQSFLGAKHPDGMPEAVQAAHDALALLGDVPELQSRWCRAVDLAPAETNQRIEDLSVGGWFGIYSISRFLLPEYRDRFLQAKAAYSSTHPGNDMMEPPIQVLALQLLERLVPSPPVRWNIADLNHVDTALARAPVWLKWIGDNRARLVKLRPTGEGVVFTLGACTEK